MSELCIPCSFGLHHRCRRLSAVLSDDCECADCPVTPAQWEAYTRGLALYHRLFDGTAVIRRRAEALDRAIKADSY